MSNFYVYQYLREDNTPYYIGKGKDKRAWNSHKRSNGTELLPKDKSKIVIIENDLTAEEATNLEIKLIAKFGRVDLDTGILHNMTNGGDGIVNPTPSHRKAVSKSNKQRLKNKQDPFLNPSQEIRQRITDRNNALVDAGTHPFQQTKNKQKRFTAWKQAIEKLVAEGKHNSQQKENQELLRNLQKKLVDEGTHNFIGLNEQRLADGTHNFLHQLQPAKIKLCCLKCKQETNLVHNKKHLADKCPEPKKVARA